MLSRVPPFWMVVRQEDGAVLARFSAKPKALAAAIRFAMDGRDYHVVAEVSVETPATEPAATVVRFSQ
jgi:hypothetical protein